MDTIAHFSLNMAYLAVKVFLSIEETSPVNFFLVHWQMIQVAFGLSPVFLLYFISGLFSSDEKGNNNVN